MILKAITATAITAASAGLLLGPPAVAGPATEQAHGRITLVAYPFKCLAATGTAVVTRPCSGDKDTWVITKKPNGQAWISPDHNTRLCIGQSPRNHAAVIPVPCPPLNSSSPVHLVALADGVYAITYDGKLWLSVTSKAAAGRAGTYTVNWKPSAPGTPGARDVLLTWAFPQFHAIPRLTHPAQREASDG